jgi:hypothetical protein
MVITLAGKELVINEFKQRQLQHYLRMLSLVCHSLHTEATAEELLREYIAARREQDKAA